MMIQLPNDFLGDNQTLCLKLEAPCDLSDLYPYQATLDDRIRQQLSRVQQLSVTFSKMRSSINTSDWIDYLEVIIKVPVMVGGLDYDFPLVSYVSDEWSFVRGAYLGFYKRLIEVSDKKEEKLVLVRDQWQIALELAHMTTRLINHRESKPFLLHRRSNLFVPANSLGYLAVNDYQVKVEAHYHVEQLKVGYFEAIPLYLTGYSTKKTNSHWLPIK